MKYLLKKISALLVALFVTATLLPFSVFADAESGAEERIQAIVKGMTLDEKISQMIVPAIRSWNGRNVTDLNAVPELSEALRKHQYGGVILYGANIESAEQTTRLVSDLQKNNAQITASTKIPYLMPVDMEGGIVNRLGMGTRMTGNMALGATGSKGKDNAKMTGSIIAEEMAALGFNADFAPVVDVNNNPENPVIGTRSFSDDPEIVKELGVAFTEGLAESNVIGTYKHFPGHGDTGTDSHIGTPSVEKTLEELEQVEFVPFRTAIQNGADMIMTAHITYPLIDETHTFTDGSTGVYPATMSRKMMTEILRESMGYQGVIVTDALEMDAIMKANLVPGDAFSEEYAANVAEQVIKAGVDILLLPTDLNGTNVTTTIGHDDAGNSVQKTFNKIDWYEGYISRLMEKVSDGTIDEALIDASVSRILRMKEKYGILDLDTSGADIEEKVAAANAIVGSSDHHAEEMLIALQAITLVKNENETLPLKMDEINLVIAGRTETELTGLGYFLDMLKHEDLIPEDTYVINLNSGETSGSADSKTRISTGYYLNNYAENPALQQAVSEADAVIAISNTWGSGDFNDNSSQYLGIQSLKADVQEHGGKMIVLSDNLPYDSARYQDVDAIVLAYMGSAMGTDPTEREGGNRNAYNANVVAALAVMCGFHSPEGTLPVNVPAVVVNEDGSISYTDKALYTRGTGLTYTAPEPEPDTSTEPDTSKEPESPTETKPETPTKPEQPTTPNQTTKAADENKVKTGDQNNMLLWIAAMSLAVAIGAGGLMITKRKSKK